MKKLIASSTLLLCLCVYVKAQFLPGVNTSNYNGVLGTFSNPSNALGKYKWDVHLFGLSEFAGNKDAKVKLSDIGTDDFLNKKLLGESGYNSAIVNVDVPAIGVLIGAGKKTSFAITSRGRVFVNAAQVDVKLVNALMDDDESDATYPYTLVPGNPLLVTANALTDYGFTWANEIINKGSHYLKGGITAKYISGVGNASVNADIAGVLDKDDKDTYLSPGTGDIDLRASGVDLDDFSIDKLYQFNGGGLGFDLGLTYEYRPQSWNNTDLKEALKAHGQIPYQFKFSASLMDIGHVKYTPDTSMSKAYAVHIPADEKFYLSDFEGTDIDNVTEVFDAYPQYFTKTGTTTQTYKVSLPTTLRLNFDYNIGKGFFANLDAQISMKSGDNKEFVRAYNTYSLTPRFEGKKIGVFLPISVNQLSGLNIGAGFHLGPLYIGSGSILSLLTGGSKQADAFFGFRFGGLK